MSPDAADSIRARFPQTPISVVPNGSDTSLFADADVQGKVFRAATPWLGERPLSLYAGALGLVNNVGYLVRMAAALRNVRPDIRIAIVGTGAQHGALRKLACDLGVLNHNLFMLDQMAKVDVVRLFGACDLAVSTVIDNRALRANSANKVFDALAAGRPVAVNHEGWLADLIRDSGGGLSNFRPMTRVSPQRLSRAFSMILRDHLLPVLRLGVWRIRTLTVIGFSNVLSVSCCRRLPMTSSRR